MSPVIALFLCTAFVCFLLRLEDKELPKVSHALWIPTIWMLSIAGKPVGIWLGEGGADDLAGSPWDRAVGIGFLCLGLFLLARRRFDLSGVTKDNVWLMALISYMLVSIVWSDIPFTSFKRWIKELIAVVMALGVLTERNPREAFESLLRRTVYILIPFSLLLIKYYPRYGIDYGRWSGQEMWVGVTLQKNGLGRLCLIAVFFLVWTLVRRWRRVEIPICRYHTHAEVMLLFIAVWLLKGPPGAYPATALVALTLGLVMFFSLGTMKKRRLHLAGNIWGAIFVFVIALGTVLPIVAGGKSIAEGFASSLGRDATLTGRTGIWAGLLPSVEGQPILGCGFGGFWTPLTLEIHEEKEAHNGYLDVLLGLGIVGLLLTVMFLLSFFRKAQRELAYNYDWACLCLCFLLMTVVHNISESSIDSLNRHLMATLLFLSVSLYKNPYLQQCNESSKATGPHLDKRKSTVVTTSESICSDDGSQRMSY